mmetsp:Transcript_29508/g.85668  ORF Transcript_29508/g.85668 Transcript_29508/m.85668 type:complete len:83 (-) Transcript_29508:506-754(-)
MYWMLTATVIVAIILYSLVFEMLELISFTSIQQILVSERADLYGKIKSLHFVNDSRRAPMSYWKKSFLKVPPIGHLNGGVSS